MVVEVGIGVSILDRGIVDIRTCPHVAFNEEVDASELTTRGNAFVQSIRGSIWRGIRVNVEEIAHLDISPSCHGMNEATRVVIGSNNTVDGSHSVCHSLAGMLSPAFVQNHPGTYAGMMASGFDEGFVFAIEILHCIVEVAYRSTLTARRHILPHDKSMLVAPVEPKVVFELDVLTNHVHAKVLHDLQVIDHRLV